MLETRAPREMGGASGLPDREGEEGASQGSLAGWLPCLWQLVHLGMRSVFKVSVCRPQLPGTPERISSPG